MKLKCLIIDDEPVARKLLQEFVEEIEYLQLAGIAESPLKALPYVTTQSIDIIFLDINMPKLNGIDFLKSSKIGAQIIMTTAYAEYAVEAYGLDVLDYLVKPFSFERFLKAANKAKEYFELKKKQPEDSGNKYFFVKCDGKIEKIFYDELLYVEAMMNYVILHTETRKMIVYLTVKGIAEQLPVGKFLKVHKSYIVNTSKIKNIEGNEINLGSAKVTISQNLHDTVIKEILKDKMLKR